MRLVVGCSDGNTYESDNIYESEIIEELNRSNGKLGSGPFSDIVFESIDEFCEFMVLFAIGSLPDGLKVTSFTLPINGRSRVFAPGSIIWAEAVRDGESER